jgi:P-type E1-E2 ATPase
MPVSSPSSHAKRKTLSTIQHEWRREEESKKWRREEESKKWRREEESKKWRREEEKKQTEQKHQGQTDLKNATATLATLSERVTVFEENASATTEPPSRRYSIATIIACLGALATILVAVVDSTGYAGYATNENWRLVIGFFGSMGGALYRATQVVLVIGSGIPALVTLFQTARREREQLTRLAAGFTTFAAGIALGTASIIVGVERIPVPFITLHGSLVAASLLLTLAALSHLLGARIRFSERESLHTIALPKSAKKIERGAVKNVAVSLLAKGHSVLVTEGEMVPVDGVVLEGSGLVDEHVLLSTLVPAQKKPGARLYAGTRIMKGRFLMTVSATADATVLSQLQHSPDDTLDRTRAEEAVRLVRVTGWGGIALAIVFGIAGGLISIFYGLILASALLAGSACSAVSASALGHRSASTAVARTGARIRSGDALAKLATVDTVVLEKTGVITTGRVNVEHVVSFRPYTQQQVLNLAAAVEVHSESLVGKTIVSFSRQMGAISLQRADDVEEEEGRGIRGRVSGKDIIVGTVAYAQEQNVRVPHDALSVAEEGKSIYIVAQEKDVIGFIALRDATREETESALAAIRSSRRSIVMLTSDHRVTAESRARAVHIDTVIADVAPRAKDAALAALRKEGKRIALVALNPQPSAEVSIVLFDGRTDNPLTGDIVVRHDDLTVVSAVFDALDRESALYSSTVRLARGIASAGLVLGVLAPYLVWILGVFSSTLEEKRNLCKLH